MLSSIFQEDYTLHMAKKNSVGGVVPVSIKGMVLSA
jgi:hypothetical protein